MQSPPTVPSATDHTEPVRRRDWAGEPGLLLGEDAQGYEELLAQVRRALKSRDVMEEMWIRDVVDLAWDIFRLRRMKANLLQVRASNAVWDVLGPLVATPAISQRNGTRVMRPPSGPSRPRSNRRACPWIRSWRRRCARESTRSNGSRR